MRAPPSLEKESKSEEPEFASPACLAHEMDAAYMGFAAPCEILAALNECRDGIVACQRLSLRLADETTDYELETLAKSIHRKEAGCRHLLGLLILTLGGTRPANPEAAPCDGEPRALPLLNDALGSLTHKLGSLAARMRDETMAAEIRTLRIAQEEAVAVLASHTTKGL